ncbi:MAG TPA: molybdopterin dinucleotide binding domain-containing protein, partial [Alphaproteobacteria bacterium]|nr:molybdopterin dinucleotide binding domain-containing protein [Alphaproteobacteria bacterium]
LSAREMWGFKPPRWKGIGAAHMILAAERGEIAALWQSGGNFKHTLPEPDLVRRALGQIKLRVHQDIVINPTMLVDPAETVVLLPTRTRYEQRSGGTETSTERRIIFSPQIPGGPNIPDARDEWEIPVMLAHKLDPQRASAIFPWKDTQDIRNEIDRVCPAYRGIAQLTRKGDNFQYGGPRLLTDSCLTPDGKAHFSVVDLPEEDPSGGRISPGWFRLATRRGKQFNSMINAEFDPITGAHRSDVLMARVDAERLGLREGDPILLRNDLGEFGGRVKIDRVKPGSLQAHWPEINVLVPAGRLDPSGVPDYNATVEVIKSGAAGT